MLVRTMQRNWIQSCIACGNVEQYNYWGKQFYLQKKKKTNHSLFKEKS